MNKELQIRVAITAIVLTMLFIIVPQRPVFADINDGTYKIDYEMKEADNDNTSIADGYFTSPAKLTVEDGTKRIELTVTGADMIKSLSAPSGEVDVVNEDEDNDERTVRFDVDDDLSEPLDMEMHVVVPDLYDTTHTARAVFDVNNMEAMEAETSNDESENKAEDNPSTGDESSITFYVVLILASAIALLIVRKRRSAQD